MWSTLLPEGNVEEGMLKRVGLLQCSKKQQHIFIFLFFKYITLLLSKKKLIDIGICCFTQW